MKIPNALVGYLGTTALKLPFHPFAFASTLALATIDYDGYGDTTKNHIDGAHMKQVPGTIVETCQAVTTQNHKDVTLMKRVPGGITEARQVPVAGPVIGFIFCIVLDVVFSIDWIADRDDDPVRGNLNDHDVCRVPFN